MKQKNKETERLLEFPRSPEYPTTTETRSPRDGCQKPPKMARQTTALLTAILTSTQFLVAIASPDTSTNPAAKGKLPFSSFTHPDAVFHEQRKRQAAPGDGSSCDDAANIMRACVAAIPDYGSATDSELAGCVCCDDGKWGADYFDQPVSSCVTYLEENYPEETEMAHGK